MLVAFEPIARHVEIERHCIGLAWVDRADTFELGRECENAQEIFGLPDISEFLTKNSRVLSRCKYTCTHRLRAHSMMEPPVLKPVSEGDFLRAHQVGGGNERYNLVCTGISRCAGITSITEISREVVGRH